MRIYSLYRRSSKKWKELKALGETLEEHVVKPTRSQGTRWINHRRKALAALASNYRCVIAHLLKEQEESGPDKAKLKSYCRQLTSSKFVLHVAVYKDILAELSELSLDFQADELSLSSVRSRVMASQTALLRLREKPGPYLRLLSQTQPVLVFSNIRESTSTTSQQPLRHSVTKWLTSLTKS